MTIEYTKKGVAASELQIDEFVFSAGGGLLFGAAAGFAIKKVMKIAVEVVGLFVAALAYLSYKGVIDLKWVAMENITRSALTNASGQVVHALNNTGNPICIASICCHVIRTTNSSCVWICSWTVHGVQEGIKNE
jgi:uncharacterized membrane protein (Fun14 family)